MTERRDRPHFIAYAEDPETHRVEPFVTGIEKQDVVYKAEAEHSVSGRHVWVMDEWALPPERILDKKRVVRPGRFNTRWASGGGGR